MNVDFLCRFTKPPSREVTEEIEEYLKDQKIIYGEDFNINFERDKLISERIDKYEYSPLSFDLKDIKLYNAADEIHTSVRFYGGESFVIKCDYDKFKNIYQFFTGKLVHSFTNPDNIKLEFLEDGE